MHDIYQFILEIHKLKTVFRNTITLPDRKESTAEHSWSASMIVMILMNELKKEFSEIDELKTIKLTLIHDLVEIYAGDAFAFDAEARKEKEVLEKAALKKLMQIYPDFGCDLHDLWMEFEEKESLEAKIAKAADAICPIFLRIHTKQTLPISFIQFDQVKSPYFAFSKTFSAFYEKLKVDLMREAIFQECN